MNGFGETTGLFVTVGGGCCGGATSGCGGAPRERSRGTCSCRFGFFIVSGGSVPLCTALTNGPVKVKRWRKRRRTKRRIRRRRIGFVECKEKTSDYGVVCHGRFDPVIVVDVTHQL